MELVLLTVALPPPPLLLPRELKLLMVCVDRDGLSGLLLLPVAETGPTLLAGFSLRLVIDVRVFWNHVFWLDCSSVMAEFSWWVTSWRMGIHYLKYI